MNVEPTHVTAAVAEEWENRYRRQRMAMTPAERRKYVAIRRRVYDLSTQAAEEGVYIECWCDTGMKHIFVNNIGRTTQNPDHKGNGRRVLNTLSLIAGDYGLTVRLEYEAVLDRYYRSVGFVPIKVRNGITIAELK